MKIWWSFIKATWDLSERMLHRSGMPAWISDKWVGENSEERPKNHLGSVVSPLWSGPLCLQVTNSEATQTGNFPEISKKNCKKNDVKEWLPNSRYDETHDMLLDIHSKCPRSSVEQAGIRITQFLMVFGFWMKSIDSTQMDVKCLVVFILSHCL